MAFEFDLDGSLWAVTRNEDGDASGFGSHLCRAPAEDLSAWDCPAQTDPERYDSPKMFRHEGEIYLVARRDIGGPYDRRDTDLSLAQRRGRYLIDYSLRPKRTALYRIDRTARRVVHVMDLPGVGDTAFPSVRQTGPHSFLLANYTSPLDDPDISWLQGQTSNRGTQIYLATIDFVPYSGPTHTPTLTPTPTPTPTRAPTEERPPLELSPVFAAPGTPLILAWPEVASLVGLIDLGDGTRVGPETVEHAYPAGDAIYEHHGLARDRRPAQRARRRRRAYRRPRRDATQRPDADTAGRRRRRAGDPRSDARLLLRPRRRRLRRRQRPDRQRLPFRSPTSPSPG